jgi:hypothetical protein
MADSRANPTTVVARGFRERDRRAIHRCQMMAGGDDVHYIFVRVGEGETVVNVDGPGTFAAVQREKQKA